jgi:hypothetical protein
MHTFPWEGRSDTQNGEEVDTKVSFHHNGDYSGRVIINLPTEIAEPCVHHFTEKGEDLHIAEIQVPFQALEAFVLDAIRALRIAALENLTVDEMRRDFSA